MLLSGEQGPEMVPVWLKVNMGFPGGSVVKNPLVIQRPGFDLWIGKIPWRRKCQPIPVFLPEESHGPRGLAGYSPWSCKELDTTKQLTFYGEQIMTEDKPRELLNRVISLQLNGRPDLQRIL